MSYINMDHAGWVESNIAASKRHSTKAELRKAKEERRGWAAAPDTLNDFQRRAFTILGIVGGGIYNAPISWKTLYWDRRVLICAWHKGFGTFDFSELTRFVFLCHEARIRAGISVRCRTAMSRSACLSAKPLARCRTGIQALMKRLPNGVRLSPPITRSSIASL